MNKNRLFRTLAFVVIIAISFSCNKYQKILKKGDMNEKYETVFKIYEKKDYITALQFLDELIPLYRGSEKMQKLMNLYPWCYYHNGDYMLASYHFKQYARLFPNAQDTEEAEYMVAYCSYLDSAPFSLDQTNTHTAIGDLQLFINKYPKSERVAQCNELMDELREKLARKDFELAKLYFNIESYNAAAIAFNNLLKDYPETKHREEAFFYLVKNYYIYANKSTEAKKVERYRESIEYFQKLNESFPESEYVKEAESIAKASRKNIERIEQNK